MAKKLTAARKKYAEGRVKGLSRTKAAQLAGSKRPAEAGCRWDKEPEVQAYMTALRRAAEAVDGIAQVSQGAQVSAQEAAQLVSEITDVLRLQRAILDETKGARVTKEWVEHEFTPGTSETRPVKVQRRLDGPAAAALLAKHYDSEADRKAGVNRPSVNVLAILGKLPPETRGELARALLAADTIDVPGKRVE